MAGGVAKATCYDEVLEYKYSDTFRQAYAPDSRASREAFLPRIHQKRKAPRGCFFFGGYGGSRTRVRKPLDMNFSVGS